MITERNKALTRELYTAFSKGNLDELDAIVAADVVDHDDNTGFGELPPGRAGLKQLMGTLRMAFPDLDFDIQQMFADGDCTVTRVLLKGTNTGDFLTMPATGRTISVPAVDVVRWQDGLAVEHWGVYDNGAMMTQLGLIPEPGTA